MLQLTGVVSESTQQAKLFSSLYFHVQIDTIAAEYPSN